MALIWSSIRSAQRLFCQDSARLTDGEHLSLFNSHYCHYREEVSPRTKMIGGNTFLGGILSSPVKSFVSASQLHRSILGIYPQASGTATDPSVSPWERTDIHRLRQMTSGFNVYAAERHQHSTAANSGKWTFYLATTTSEDYNLAALVLDEVTALAADADQPELSDSEAYMVARFAAAEAAKLLGRDDAFVQGILAPVELAIKGAMGFAVEGAGHPRAGRKGEG